MAVKLRFDLNQAITDIERLDRGGCLDRWQDAFGRPPPKYLASVHQASVDLGSAKQGTGWAFRRHRAPPEADCIRQATTREGKAGIASGSGMERAHLSG